MSLWHYNFILLGLGATFGVTFLSFAIGALMGFPVALLRMSRFLAARALMIVVIAMVRSIPPIVWLFVVFFGISSGAIRLSPFVAAIIVFGLISAVNMAEIYRGSILSIHKGQFEAATALGLTPAQSLRDVVIPQMLRICIPPSATYLIGLLKNSSIASTIGVMEVTFRGTIVSEQILSGLDVFIYVGLIYIVISVPIAVLSRRLDARLRAVGARQWAGG